MATPILDFHLFVFKILAFNDTTSSKTFDVARDLYRMCKYVVYGSYGPPFTWWEKLSYNFF